MKKFISLFYGLITFLSFGLILSGFGVDPLIASGVSLVVSVTLSSLVEVDKFVFFTSICGELNADIDKNCDNPLQAGTTDRLVVINKGDILSYSTAVDGSLTNIVLRSGAVAHKIDGQQNSIEPDFAMVKQTYVKMFDHMVRAKGFNLSPATKQQLNDGKDGRYVLICENYYRGDSGNAAFEVYGLTTGLEMNELSRTANSEETQGAFDILFSTDQNKEPKMPATLFDTDYATTKAIVDALLV
jgi:hypothetical protein